MASRSALQSVAATRHLMPRFLVRSISTQQWRPFALVLAGRRDQNESLRSQQQRGVSGITRSLLANREAAANKNPSSASAQNAFYQTLLMANMPAIVVERYQSGRFASNDATDDIFATASKMLNGTSAVLGSPNSGSTSLDPKVQAVAQAVAARSRGGSGATSKPNETGSKSGRIHVVIDEPFGSTIYRWVSFFLWFGFFTYLSMIVVTMMLDSLNMIRRPGGRGDSTEVKAEKQKARFSDVHGCDEAKEELQDLVEFLKNPEKFNTLGGKLPKGVLLVGPPGTGKTLLARAVAGEAGVPFFYMSGSEFDEIYVGVGAKRVRDLFSGAKAKAPAIVFIDELDAIGGRRNAKDAAYVKQTLNQLLTELDGFDQDSGVIILAATNFPELLDKALTRPGRFDRHVTVELPDYRGRIAILKHHAKGVKMATDVKLEAIAGQTPGLSGAELENIVNSAAIHASKAKAKLTTQADLDWARDKVIMGAEKKGMVITAEEKMSTAYHEAGHALVSLHSPDSGWNLYKVTILPRGRSLGHTSFMPDEDKLSWRARDYRASIDRAMGGKVAEEIVYGPDYVTGGASSDLDSATRMAYQMVARLGMSERLGPMQYMDNYENLSSETKSMIEEEVRKVLSESYERARKLLTTNRGQLDLLAKALCEFETLDKTEVERVIRGEKLLNRIPAPLSPMVIPKPDSSLVPGGDGLPPLPGTPAGDRDAGPGTAPPPPAGGGMAA